MYTEYTPHNLSQVAFLATTKLSAHFLVGHPLCCDPGVISSILQFNFAAEARELSLIPIPKIFHSWIEPIIYPTWRKASETYRLLTSAYFPIPLYIISARIRLRRILFDTPENKEKAQDHTVFKHLATNLDRKNENNVVNKMLRLSGSMVSKLPLVLFRSNYD